MAKHIFQRDDEPDEVYEAALDRARKAHDAELLAERKRLNPDLCFHCHPQGAVCVCAF